MKRHISFLASFLLCSLVACGAPSLVPLQIENTALPTEPVEIVPSSTSTPELQPTADLPTITPAALQPGQPNAIQFAANGTYVDIADSIAIGLSKTYSINALKGQIMSISILPQIPAGGWGYIPMQVIGADGSVLCPQPAEIECMFWRGLLPSSQNYFVTLTPSGDVPQFVMRVAINPLGKDVQYFEYVNSANGLSLTYPDTFAPALPVVGNYKAEPELTLQFIDSDIYEKTNLGEAYLFISSTADSQVVTTCTEPSQNGASPEQVVGIEVVNGFTFVHSTSSGAGAGNYYEQEIYRMAYKNRCYEVIYFIHSSNVGNYPPGTVTEFDRDALIQALDSVFSTFTIQ